MRWKRVQQAGIDTAHWIQSATSLLGREMLLADVDGTKVTGSASPRTTPAFHSGPQSVRTAFVLAVPGRKEREAERPAAGDTGDNLDRILIHLNRHDPEAYPSICRYDYWIANALATIMFGDNSMSDLADVREPNSLARLAEQLKGMTTVVALSATAMEGVTRVGLHPTHSHAVHPGMRRLNNYHPGLGREPKFEQRRTEERCRRFAAKVIASRG